MSETEAKVIDQVEENAQIDLDDLMRKYDTEARFRALTGWQGKMVALLAVAMSCFHFYTSGFGLLLAQKQGAVHLAFTLALVFLLYPATSKQSKTSGIPFYDFILAGLGVASALYLVFFFNDLVTRAGLPTTADLVMGFILIATLLEATRRISKPRPALPRRSRAALLLLRKIPSGDACAQGLFHSAHHKPHVPRNGRHLRHASRSIVDLRLHVHPLRSGA